MAPRILYVITKANWGGAQHYVYDLACAARDSGYPIAVAYGLPGELANRLSAERIQTFVMNGLGRDIHVFNDIVAFFSLMQIIRSFRPDVIHLNSSKIGGLGALAARLLGVKTIIFTGHAWTFNEERPYYQKCFIAFFAWLTVLLSTRTIVVSRAMREQIIHGPFTRRKVVIIPNGARARTLLNKREAREALTALHPSLLISDVAHDVWIGTVAELHHVKGLPYAIEAIKIFREHYPAIRYIILGEGQMRATLEKQIIKNGLQHTVFLLGQVKDAMLYGKAYDVFLLPSLSESFGISLLEAGLAELPVVATRVGGIPEIITHGETGLLVPPKDPEAITYATTSLLTDEPFRKNLGIALRHKVEKEFTVERTVRETFACYSTPR